MTGPIEKQAREDVANMGPLTGGARATYAQLAFNLAAALDRAFGEEVPLAEVTTGSKVLLAILGEVAKTAGASSKSEELQKWIRELRSGSLVGDPEDVGTGHGREAGSSGLADVGEAADAAPALHRGRGAGAGPGDGQAGLRRHHGGDRPAAGEDDPGLAEDPASGPGF